MEKPFKNPDTTAKSVLFLFLGVVVGFFLGAGFIQWAIRTHAI